MKKALVLLSTYNGEKYLIELIESLLAQKNINIDILVRDDGSTDSTKKILRKYQDKHKNIYCYFEKNIGPTNSFFDLIRLAPLDYDYYALCDQDDVWLDNKISVAVSSLSKFDINKPSLYYSGQILTDEKLNIINEHLIVQNRSVKANFIFNQMAGCTAVFNRKLLEFLKQYFPKNIYGHDAWCYRLCAILDGNIVVDSRGYILYRQHGNNVVGINNGIKGKFERAYKYIFKYSPSSYAVELLPQYKNVISDDWVDFLNNIIDSNKKISVRMKLLQNKKIKFNSFYIKCIFIIKVLLRKM